MKNARRPGLLCSALMVAACTGAPAPPPTVPPPPPCPIRSSSGWSANLEQTTIANYPQSLTVRGRVELVEGHWRPTWRDVGPINRDSGSVIVQFDFALLEGDGAVSHTDLAAQFQLSDVAALVIVVCRGLEVARVPVTRSGK